MTKIENFKPSQYEIKSNNGFAVEWNEADQRGEARFKDKRSYESADLPHPDLLEKVKEIGTILLTMLNISIPQEEEEDENGEVKGDKIVIKRLDVSGDDQPEAAKITAYIKHTNGQKTNISTPFIKFSEKNYGIETDLQSVVNQMAWEAFEYVVSHKRAQLSIFGDSNPDDEGAEKTGSDDQD